jgi:alpha-beta hydrolase superfamily lysophospholipase
MKMTAAAGTVRGAAVICHGFGEHSGSYDELAGRLGQAGYASVVYTQRGHGELPEKQKGVIPGYRCFLDDLGAVIGLMAEKYPSSPVILYGHSMGGNIVANYLLRQGQTGITCAVLESPWFGLYKEPNILLSLAAKCLGNLAVINKLNLSDITSDPEKADWIGNDPLYHNRISMRLLSGIMNGCAFALKNAPELSVPAFIAFAEHERIVSNGAIMRFAKAAGTAPKRYDSCHAIHNDVKREDFFTDMITFLNARCPIVSHA